MPYEDRFMLVAPHYDDTAIWFCMVWGSYIEKVAKFNLNCNTKVLKYNITKEMIESEIPRFDPKVFYAIGHGKENSYQGWINACENDDLLAGRICNFLSCLTGKELGSSAVSKGCLAYIGYNEVFGWVDSEYPPFGRYHWTWMDFNLITSYILRGFTVREAVEKTKKRITDWMEFWDVVMEDPDVVQAIINDLNALVIHGDENAKTEGFEPLFHEVAIFPIGPDEESDEYIYVRIGLTCQVDDCDLTNVSIKVLDEGLNQVSSATVDSRIGGINFARVAIPKSALNTMAASTTFTIIADIGGIHGTAVGFVKVSSRLPVTLTGYVWKYYRNELGEIVIEPATNARVYDYWKTFEAITDENGKYEVVVPARTYYMCSSLEGWLGFCTAVPVSPTPTTQFRARCDGFVIPYAPDGHTQLLLGVDVQWLPIWPPGWGELGKTNFEVPDWKVVFWLDGVNYGNAKDVMSPLYWVNHSISFASAIITNVPEGKHELRIDYEGYYIVSEPEKDYYTKTLDISGTFSYYGCALFKRKESEDICIRVFDAVTLDSMPNIKLELLDESNTVIATTRTDRLGHAWFTDLPIANYRIRATIPGYRELITDVLKANEIWGVYLPVIPEGRLKVRVNSNIQHYLKIGDERIMANGDFYPLPGTYTLTVPRLVIEEQKVPPDILTHMFASWWDGDASTSKEVYLGRDMELSESYRSAPRLIIRAVGKGSVNPSPGVYYRELNESLLISAGPNLLYWDVDGERVYENTINLIMDKNHTVTAYFSPIEYTLQISSTEGGITDPPPGTYRYPEGSTVTVRAIPNDGYEFDYWQLNGEILIDNPISLTINKDLSLTAYFTPIAPPITRRIGIFLIPIAIGAILELKRRTS